MLDSIPVHDLKSTNGKLQDTYIKLKPSNNPDKFSTTKKKDVNIKSYKPVFCIKSTIPPFVGFIGFFFGQDPLCFTSLQGRQAVNPSLRSRHRLRRFAGFAPEVNPLTNGSLANLLEGSGYVYHILIYIYRDAV